MAPEYVRKYSTEWTRRENDIKLRLQKEDNLCVADQI